MLTYGRMVQLAQRFGISSERPDSERIITKTSAVGVTEISKRAAVENLHRLEQLRNMRPH